MAFGGGSKKTNDTLVQEQKAQAAEADAKEAARQARLAAGRASINAVFDGGTTTVPGASRTVSERVQGPAVTKYVPKGHGVVDTVRTPGAWTTKNTVVTDPGTTTTTKGIGQDFYEGFRKSLSDFYNPEVTRQFDDAKKENLFDLARRGTLRSSDAVTKNENLTRDYSNANAKVQSDIEGQVSGLKTDVNNSRTRALGLLTSTEDPTTAANAAATEVNAIQSRSPTFNTLGDLFASAINSYSTFKNGQAGRAAVAGVPSKSPYASSGKVYG